MLKNYLLIAYRSLSNNRIFSYINILGLAIGMAAFLFIVQYIRYEKSYENFHENADNILRLATEFYNGSEYVMTDCETYPPLGPYLKANWPEVTEYVRMDGIDGLTGIKTTSKSFLESGLYYVDASIFDVFTVKILHGEKRTALQAPFEVALSESMAKKYFGKSDVVDEIVEIGERPYRVSAVFADIPQNTHLKFSILISRGTLKTMEPWYAQQSWYNNNDYTYVLTVPGTDLAAFNKKLANFVATDLKEELSQENFVAERIKDIHLYSDKMFEPEPAGNAKVVYYFTIIAVFVIAIAWVNYINLSTARAVERAREVGIRKVMGSVKRQLIFQFMAEAALMNILAGAVSLALFQLMFPLFRDLSGQPLSGSIIGDSYFWEFFAGLVATGSLLSGLYPAFVLASFKPVAVLKGKFRSTSHGQWLRKGLVVFQFSATVVLIIGMLTFYLQLNFLRQQDLGMDIDQTLVLTGPKLNITDSVFHVTSQTLKNELLSNASIRGVSRSESLPGADIQELSTANISRVGASDNKKGYLHYFMAIDEDFIPTLNMTIAAGRNFKAGGDNSEQVIINEEAARLLGFYDASDALGNKISFITKKGSDGSEIIGVLKDFHFRSPKDPHLPMVFYCREPGNYFALRMSTNDVPQTLAFVKQSWDKVYPDAVFNYFFLDEQYDQQYRADQQFGGVITAFSILILFIACLGLFGLSSYTIVQRTKEIGIRKVLGASVVQVVRLLSKDFLKVVLQASLVALPLTYFTMAKWLSNYAMRIELGFWIFAIPVALIFMIALLTVSIQTIKTALSNPTEALRYE